MSVFIVKLATVVRQHLHGALSGSDDVNIKDNILEVLDSRLVIIRWTITNEYVLYRAVGWVGSSPAGR